MTRCVILLPLLLAVLPGSAAASKSPLEIPNLSGMWARAQVTTALVDIPIVGEMASRTMAVTLLRLRQEGSEVVVDEKVCRLTTQAPTRLVSTTYPDAFVRAVSGNQRRGRIKVDDGRIRYVEPKQAYWRGMQPGVDVAGPMPVDSNDPRVGDVDADGQPGLTVKVGGIVDGEIFLVQRSWSELDGVLRSRNRIEGSIAWGSEEQILGASSSLLESSPKKRPAPETRKNFFRMRRVPKSATCAEVLARRQKLFGF